jgi:hypothetical protein
MTNAQRVKHVRARARVRRWEYRQRHLARGAWHELRLALAAAREVYAIEESELAELVREGCVVDARGRRLEPPRELVWIAPERVAALRTAHRLALRLDAELLAAPVLALVPFPPRRGQR